MVARRRVAQSSPQSVTAYIQAGAINRKDQN